MTEIQTKVQTDSLLRHKRNLKILSLRTIF